MKAIVQDEYGSADVLRLTHIDTPVVGDNDVLLRVLRLRTSGGPSLHEEPS